MIPLSVIILTKNEARNIENCIRSAKLVSQDIIVVDCGSNDDTVVKAGNCGAKIIFSEWTGFGSGKNRGAASAGNDWIFCLDADEEISPALALAIRNIKFIQTDNVYCFRRENYFEYQKMRFGTPGFDTVARIYHRRTTRWDLSPVHEKLCGNFRKIRIDGTLVHSNKTFKDYKCQLAVYAGLCAKKYFEEKRPASFLKKYAAAFFNSFKSYFLQFGFLDGFIGFKLAVLLFFYTRLKYDHLSRMYSMQKQEFSLGEAD